MDFKEYKNFDAVGLAGLVRRGEVSQQELVETAIRAAEATHPIINAIVTPDYDRARAATARPGPPEAGLGSLQLPCSSPSATRRLVKTC